MGKDKIFSEIDVLLKQSRLNVMLIDKERPWGGFFVIDENDAKNFLDQFFPDINKSLLIKGKLSPKILLVEPGKKLSWQYHHRRAELWKLIRGSAGLVRSDNDKENAMNIMVKGDIIELKQGERHRLIGLQEWGIIAEIWMHIYPNHPSNEEDIVRVQDDFGR